jgi:signal transduction histidine kinase
MTTPHNKLTKLLEKISQLLLSVRYGHLNQRLDHKLAGNFPEIVNNFNNMLESIEDRELMIKEYQKELSSQKEYLLTVFNSLNEGVLTLDSKCKIISANNRVCEWLNLSKSEITTKRLDEFFHCDCKHKCNQDKKDCLTELCPLITQDITSIPMKLYVKANQNNLNIFNLSISKLYFSNEDPNFVFVLRDITKEIELEHLRDNFVATLTHDLRVPLLAETNTIKLFQKEAFGSTNEKQKEALSNMLDCNNELIDLVNSLLDIYKIEGETYELQKENIDISILIDDILSEFKFLFEKNKHTVKVFIDLKKTKIPADKDDIKRVLRNLINNAIIHTQKGGTLSISAYKDKKYLYVNIQDNGRGISPNDLEKIFDRYYSTAKKFRKIGTGLGLYLVKSIIEMHGGEINVKSEEGKGSEFIFSLPLK